MRLQDTDRQGSSATQINLQFTGHIECCQQTCSELPYDPRLLLVTSIGDTQDLRHVVLILNNYYYVLFLLQLTSGCEGI